VVVDMRGRDVKQATNILGSTPGTAGTERSADACAVGSKHVNRDVGSDWSDWVLACPVGAAVLDRALQVVAINPALTERTGAPAEAAIGRPLAEAVPWLGPQLELLLRTVLESGRPFVDVELSAEPAGPRRVRITGFPTP